jgi:hypothetical protein
MLFNNENLILLKGLKDFFLYRFFEINEKWYIDIKIVVISFQYW